VLFCCRCIPRPVIIIHSISIVREFYITNYPTALHRSQKYWRKGARGPYSGVLLVKLYFVLKTENERRCKHIGPEVNEVNEVGVLADWSAGRMTPGNTSSFDV
jgi:hypothetical protein